MSHCFTCGGEGFPDKKCPSCGREPKKLNLSKLNEKEVVKFIEESKLVRIPEQYIGVEWSAEIFWRNHTEALTQEGIKDRLLADYVARLQKVHDIFAEGSLPRKGAIIIAPSTYSKMVWAYSCMQHALRNDYKVAPLLDTLEVHRLLAVGAENPKYKLYGEIDHDEYFMSDVVFVTVTKTEYKKTAYMVIQELFDRRSRKGLPTFVLSQVGIEVLGQWDRTGNFMKIKKVSRDENNMKVPVLITYKEGLS
jgi:hypothetical protein